MIKINYFDERELLFRREIETKAPKSKTHKCYPSEVENMQAIKVMLHLF